MAAQRDLRVRISIDTAGLTGDVARAAAAFNRVGAAATGAANTVGGATRRMGTGAAAAGAAHGRAAASGASAWGRMGVTLSTVGARVNFGAASMASVVAFSVYKAAKEMLKIGMAYEVSINTIKATTNATAEQMDRVKEKARELGRDITIPGQSAADAAEGMNALAKGGLNVDQSMAAAKGTLQLATAAQITAAKAAEIEANALSTFALKASDATRVSDTLANVSIATAGTMNDFALGMKQSGLVAASLGMSIEDTASTLGIFALAGMKGSDGGTSFRTMMLALEHPTKRQKTAMDELGIVMWDANGDFIGMRQVVGQLETAQKNMTTENYTAATATAFGADAVRAASAAARAGVDGWDRMSKKIKDGGGAAQLSSAQMAGVTGAVNNLTNQAEDLAIAFYEKVAPSIESFVTGVADGVATVGPYFLGVVDSIGSLITKIGELPTPVLLAIGAFAAFLLLQGPVVAMGIAMWAPFKRFGQQMAVQTALAGGSLTRMGAVGSVAAMRLQAAWKAVGKTTLIGVGISALVWAIGAFSSSSEKAKEDAEAWEGSLLTLKGTLDETTGAVTAMTRGKVIQEIGGATINSYKQLGLNTELMVDAMALVPGALQKSAASMSQVVQSNITGGDTFKKLSPLMEKAGVSAEELANAYLNSDYDSIKGKFAAIGYEVKDLGNGTYALTDKTTGLVTAIGSSATELTAVKAAYQSVNGKAGDFATVQQNVKTEIAAASTATDTATGAIEGMGGAADGAAGAVEGFGGATGDAVGPTGDFEGAVDDAKDAADELEKRVKAANDELDIMQHRETGAAKTTLELADGIRDFGERVRAIPQALRDQEAANEAVTKAEIAKNEAENKTIDDSYTVEDRTLAVSAAQRDLDEAHVGVATAAEDVSKAHQELAVAEDEARASTTEVAAAAFVAAGGWANMEGATEAARVAAEAHITALRDEYIACGHSATEADVYVASLGLIPSEVATAVKTTGVADAEEAARKVAAEWAKVREDITIRVTTQYKATGSTAFGGSAGKAVDDATAMIPYTAPPRPKADGGIVETGYANGGLLNARFGATFAADGLDRLSRMATGGGAITWNEPETGWEAYISGKPSQLGRNRKILQNAASRLGMTAYQNDYNTATSAANYQVGSPVNTSNVFGNSGGPMSLTVNPTPQEVNVRVFMDGSEITSRVQVIVNAREAAQGRELLASA